jgi:DNA-binding CsgD family transcriptional regulator
VSQMQYFGDAKVRGIWERVRANGICDGIGVYAQSVEDNSVHLFAASPVMEQPSPREQRAWLRVAVHLSAGHRLRAAFRGGVARADDALLDASGRVHDAHGAAETLDARQALRDAVLSMERARGPLRHRDGEQALDLWQGLVAGRWSLVDRWDSDGKRYIAAIENRPMNLDPRALRPREGAAARLAADGASSKDIAWALGVSPSNARALLASALHRLGLTSRAELYRWNPASASVHVLPSEPKLHALVIPECEPTGWSPPRGVLTSAETTVARLAAEGLSNEDIARERGTAVRTIANQMAKILKKLRVGSRDDILRSGQPERRAS